MRQIKFNKKLWLNKSTVANLKDDQMADVRGMGDQSVPYSACLSLCMITGCCSVICPTPNSCETNQTVDPLGACCCARI